MKVILISGKAQNGKDTTAEFIRERLSNDGYRVLVTHYADLLKYVCRNYFEWNGVKDERGRKLLQYVGTDVVRKKAPTLWVDFITRILECFPDSWDYVIIPDCRFPNEVSTIQNAEFDTSHLRIVRTNFDDHLTEEQRQHPSETALDGYEADYYICNDGTLSELKAKTNNWITENLYGLKA